MSPATGRKYDKDGLPVLSALESASLTWIVLRMPFVLLWTVLSSKFKKHKKPTNRLLFEASSRHILSNVSIEQLQKISGSSIDAYRKWAKEARKEPVIETLEDGTELFWIGDKSAEYVLVYCHGGGFVGPLCDFQCGYVAHVCSEFAKSSGRTIACAILNYSIHPATFPTQLAQLHTLLAAVTTTRAPSRIFLAGDSAGANIITQHLAAALHPEPTLPAPPHHSTPYAGCVLISPWCALSPAGASMRTNAHTDLLPPEALAAWGAVYAAGVPPALVPYADATRAPPGFFAGLDAHVRSVLVTLGDAEVLRDDVLVLTEALRSVHPRVDVDVQPGGVHADMVFDVAAKSKTVSPVTGRVVEWLVQCTNETQKETSGDAA